MKTTEDILKELNEYYHNIPYQGLEGCHASPSLDRSEFYAYWGILRSLPKEELSRAKDIIDKENYAEILSKPQSVKKSTYGFMMNTIGHQELAVERLCERMRNTMRRACLLKAENVL